MLLYVFTFLCSCAQRERTDAKSLHNNQLEQHFVNEEIRTKIHENPSHVNMLMGAQFCDQYLKAIS